MGCMEMEPLTEESPTLDPKAQPPLQSLAYSLAHSTFASLLLAFVSLEKHCLTHLQPHFFWETIPKNKVKKGHRPVRSLLLLKMASASKEPNLDLASKELAEKQGTA